MFASRAWLSLFALSLTFCAGCSDSSPFRFSDLRRSDRAQGPPQPAAALFIPKPPAPLPEKRDDNVKQATFVPDRPAPPADAKPQVIEHPLNVLYQRAADRYATMDSYIFRLKRREVVNGKKQTEELVKVHVRQQPYSVRLVWLSKEGTGREVVYVKGQHKNEIQLLLARGDMFPGSPAGMRFNIAPDDPLTLSKSRYPVTETGFGAVIERYGRMLVAIDKGEPRAGAAKYLGRVQRPEFEAKVEAVHQSIVPGGDPQFPKGGQRWWYFDATSGLPALVVAHDADGEVEYYCFDNILAPARLDDSDFDPSRIWRK